MQYIYTNANDPDFIQLCHELDDFLNQIAGGEEKRSQYIPLNQLLYIDDVIISYDNGKPVGCASIKEYDSEHAEVKRVFVKSEYRGRGLSKKLMKLLEEKAKERGYKYLLLESGEPLTVAMYLYQSIGYKVIPNYGQYKCMSKSICMKKLLYHHQH